jgi:parallel beta-helix repeat protein
LISYDNIGAGLYLKGENTNYAVTGSTIYGNHGVGSGEGMPSGGIWIADCAGPGTIANNLLYSCAGPGIGLWSAANLTVENNTLVDCQQGIWWRALDTSSVKLDHVTVRNNNLSGWREQAQLLEPAETRQVGQLTIDGNSYNPSVKTRLFRWGDAGSHEVAADTLTDVQHALSFEAHGMLNTTSFDHRLFPTTTTGAFEQVGHSGEDYSIDQSINDDKAGPDVTFTMPVQGRTDIVRVGKGKHWQCEVYDLATDRHVLLEMPSLETMQLVSNQVSRWAVWQPTYLKVKLIKLDSYDIRARVVLEKDKNKNKKANGTGRKSKRAKE